MERILVPLDSSRLGGPFREVEAEIEFEKDGRGIASFENWEDPIPWIESKFPSIWFQRMKDGIAKAIRLSTHDDSVKNRIPIWIQDEEIPTCCGAPMSFVGQIDDDRLCTERPEGARLWWNDAASFYVFTCKSCLEVKAVGQQY